MSRVDLLSTLSYKRVVVDKMSALGGLANVLYALKARAERDSIFVHDTLTLLSNAAMNAGGGAKGTI